MMILLTPISGCVLWLSPKKVWSELRENISSIYMILVKHNCSMCLEANSLHTGRWLKNRFIFYGYEDVVLTPTTENTNTIIQETTFTRKRHPVLDTGSNNTNGMDPLIESGDDEIGIMRDVLFRYENNSTNKEGVYFDMDANGIKEKMITWTDPNQWMVVKDINGDGQITSGREVVGSHMTLPNGTKAADTIQALKTFDINYDGKITTADNSGLAFWTDRNHEKVNCEAREAALGYGLTDIGELEALGAAGAIQVIKLNPYFKIQKKAY